MIMSVIFIISSVVVIKEVQKQNKEYNVLFNTISNNIFREKLTSLRDYSYAMVSGARTNYLSGIADITSDKETLTQAYELVNDIRRYMITNRIVDEILIYCPKSGSIMGRYGCYKEAVYWRLASLKEGSAAGYEEWSSIFRNASGFLLYDPSGEGAPAIYYVTSIKLDHNMGNQKKLVVASRLSRAFMTSVLEDIWVQGQHQYVALLDEDGREYAAVGDSRYKSVGEGSGSVFNGSVQTRTNTDIPGLYVLSVSENGNVYKFLITIIWVLVSCLISAFLIGALLSIFYSRKNSRPILTLAQKLNNKGSDKKDEFEQINAGIDELIAKNESAMKAAEQQQKILEQAYVRELVYFNRRGLAAESLYSTYGISLENEYFCLMTFSSDSSSDSSSAERADIERIVSEAQADDFIVLHTEMDGSHAFLINFEETAEGRLEAFSLDLQANAKRQVHVSKTTDSLESAVQDVRLKLQKWGEIVLNPESIRRASGMLILQSYMNAIIDRNFSQAAHILPHLFEQYVDDADTQVRRTRGAMIVAELYKEAEGDEGVRKELGKLIGAGDHARLQEELGALLNRLALASGSGIDIDGIIEKTNDIISREYDNPMLGLSMIAERLGISQSYLSKKFKQIYGMGFNYYLNGLRIEHAKQMILLGKDSIKTIALKVGFLSDVNFSRVFKKHMEMSPGKYRDESDG